MTTAGVGGSPLAVVADAADGAVSFRCDGDAGWLAGEAAPRDARSDLRSDLRSRRGGIGCHASEAALPSPPIIVADALPPPTTIP